MADYINIKNYSNNGVIGISRRVFEAIVTDAVNRVSGVKITKGKAKKLPFDLSHPIKIAFRSDGSVDIKISISVEKGANVNDVCVTIQEEVARSITAYTESVPFDIELKVVSIGH